MNSIRYVMLTTASLLGLASTIGIARADDPEPVLDKTPLMPVYGSPPGECPGGEQRTEILVDGVQASPSGSLSKRYEKSFGLVNGQSRLRKFDEELGDSIGVGHTFNLPSGTISKAWIEFVARPTRTTTSETADVSLRFSDAGNENIGTSMSQSGHREWYSRIGFQNTAGDPTGEIPHSTLEWLLGQKWNKMPVPCPVRFYLNLANLPEGYALTPPVTSVIGDMNSTRVLDFVVWHNTLVDYAKLIVCHAP